MQRVAGALGGAVLLAGLFVPLAAHAQSQPLDFALYQLGAPDPGLHVDDFMIPYDPFAQERFARFVGELGLAMTPLPSAPAPSLGQAGFDFSISEDVAYINPSQKFSDGQVRSVWPTLETAPNELYLTTLHVRKGLPFSLELDTDLSYIGRSSMVVPTVALKWTLLEGLHWVPDISIRGFASVLIGNPDMTLITAGWDMGLSYKIPIVGGVEASIYGGFQMIGLDATTTNIDFSPQHFDQANPTTGDDVFGSLSIGNPLLPATRFYRMYFGAQIKANIAVIGIDAGDGWGTNPITDGSTTMFSVSDWKIAFRAGVVF